MDDHRQRQQRLLAEATRSGPRRGDWTPPAPEALNGVLPQLEIIALIGQGGMGAVYKARQTRIDRVVAVKLMAPHLTANPDFAQRFQREAKILARLSHPHIVTLYDVGEAGPWRYLVLEFIDGATLREALTTGPFTAAAALVLAPQLCDALAYAHGQGIIHRDLKPENILIDAAGRGHIADFGLATLDGADIALAITKSGDVLGTAAYMAPEQLAGTRGIDHRADLYALGVIIYEMLTGHLPLGRFEAPSYQGRMDVRIDSVVMQALERTPEMRWQSADAMRRAVDAITPGAPPAPREGLSPAVAAALGVALTLCVVVMAYAIARLMAGSPARPPADAVTPSREAAPRAPTPGTVPQAGVPAAPPPAPIATMAGRSSVIGNPVPASAVPASSATVAAQPAPSVTPIIGPASASPSAAVADLPSATTASPAGTVTMPPQLMPPIAVTPATVPATAEVVPPVVLPPAMPPTSVLPTASASPASSASPEPVAVPDPLQTLAAAGTGRVVITGPGEMVIDVDPAVSVPMYGQADGGGGGFSAKKGADGVLTMRLDQDHQHLRVPLGFLTALRYEGSGQVTLRGCTGGRLQIDHAGPGKLVVDQVKVEDLEVNHASPYLTVLAGAAQTCTVRMTPVPPSGAGETVADGNLVDGLNLACKHVEATIDGGGCLRLQGHADSVVVVMSDGTVDANALSVGNADITVTGSGQARFGDLGAVNAACTGSGGVHWTGNPVIGRVIINK
jgi:tRNA A-37 threonylcarbamoyl transferase component Bud32